MKLKCDFHIHTALSPCAMNDMTPGNIVNMAIFSELGAIAVTDHNSCENAEAVMRCAEGTGLLVIPGMEVQTREDVHVLALFSDLMNCRALQEEVYAGLPPLKAPEKTMEKQLIVNEEDEIVGRLDKLISMSCGFSLNELCRFCNEHGGIAIPAHIDRKSNSLLANLGFVPPDLETKVLEVSMFADLEEYQKRYPTYRVVTDSDAHELGLIGAVFHEEEVEEASAAEIIRALSKSYE